MSQASHPSPAFNLNSLPPYDPSPAVRRALFRANERLLLTYPEGGSVVADLMSAHRPTLLISDLRRNSLGRGEFRRLTFNSEAGLLDALRRPVEDLLEAGNLDVLAIHVSECTLGRPTGHYRLVMGTELPEACVPWEGLTTTRIERGVRELQGRFGRLEVGHQVDFPTLSLAIDVGEQRVLDILWTFRDLEHLAQFLELSARHGGFWNEEGHQATPSSELTVEP